MYFFSLNNADDVPEEESEIRSPPSKRVKRKRLERKRVLETTENNWR